MTEEYQARLFPKEAADSIGIAPATLRKYSQIVEEETSNTDFFNRTEQNIRTYSDNNIKLMKEISTLSQDTKQPVKNIVKQLLTDNKDFLTTENKAEVKTDKIEISNTDFQELVSTVNNQNARIDQLISAINILAGEFKEVRPIIEHQQHLTMNDDDKATKEEVPEEAIKEAPIETPKEPTEQISTADKTPSKPVEVKASTQKPKKKGFFGRLFGK